MMMRSVSVLSLLAAGVSGYSPYWTPDSTKFAYGLPGSLPPFENFDPFAIHKKADLEKMKNYREAELQHGRTAMLGALGMIVTEEPIEVRRHVAIAKRER